MEHAMTPTSQRLHLLFIVLLSLLLIFSGFSYYRSVVPPAADNQALGIADGLIDLSPEQLDQRLDGFSALGVRWVRFDVQWNRIEADGPGQYDWTETDRIVQGLAKRHIEGVAMIGYTPEWARLADCTDSQMCAPRDPQAYAHFATAVAQRYHRTIRHWELWNEPNTQKFFQPAADPARYTRLLQAAYPAIKAVDHSAVVITGGTAPTSTGDGNYLSTDFLTALYNQGAGQYFDAVGHHPYTNPVTPARHNPHDAWGQLDDLHAIMAGHGDKSKRIWATEYGFPTGGAGPAADGRYPAEHSAAYVTENRQADFLYDAVTEYRRLDWAGPIFWYSYQDSGHDAASTESHYGLTRADGAHKPAYGVFSDLLK